MVKEKKFTKQAQEKIFFSIKRLFIITIFSRRKKNMIEAFDFLLKDIMESNMLFGEKVVVFGGDFRQTLPVVCCAKKKILFGKAY